MYRDYIEMQTANYTPSKEHPSSDLTWWWTNRQVQNCQDGIYRVLKLVNKMCLNPDQKNSSKHIITNANQ